MPRIPNVSPATGEPINSNSYIHTTACNFVDNHGRTLLLRGVNLSGASKAPVGMPSYVLDDFWESGERGDTSFIGRPLNIDDGSADVHLARLHGWGFNLLRFPVTWEALEHAGPGKHDHEFMDYVVRVIRKCKDYGFKVYMDPHQDTWSRYSGGSGAPFWTLAACGLDPRNFTATQAAVIHSEYPLAHVADPASLPAMIWSTNYGRLASQTLFTLFFAGRDFAPRCIIDGKNIQDYLQEHYIESFGRLADCLKDAGGLLDECVIGWDSLNEPFEGLCGWQDLNVNPVKQGSTLKKGTYPTPAQSMRLGMGQEQTVENWTFGVFGPQRNGAVTIDPKGLKIWASPEKEVDGVHPRWGWRRDPQWRLGTCVWALHGVWDVETGFIMRPEYFRYIPDAEPGAEAEFIDDYWKPHWKAYAKRIRKAHPESIMFVQPPVFAPPPIIDESELQGRCCLSTHYYDGLTLITRHWNWFNADALGVLRGKYSSPLQAVKMGERSIRKSLQEQLGVLKSDALVLSNGVPKYPTVIGEIGIPYDMDDKRSYGWTDGGKYAGDYSRQERALDASMNACDGVNALNYTIWTYCPDGTHDWGDGWNMEDLSLWCPEDMLVHQDEGNEHQEGSMFEMSDSSQAKLLAGKKAGSPTQVRKTTTAASSSLSLDTLGQVPSALPIDAQESMSIHKLRERTPRELAGWNENPYNFLTDGARAVRSFARPWPTKVVGIPTDIQFNIAKADFKMTLRVGAEDRVRVGPNGHEGDEELGTEIYVPLVHYASKHVLKGSAAAPLSRGGKDYDLESIVSESGLSTQLSHSTSPTATVKDVPTSDIGSSSSTISPLHDSREMLLLQSDNLIDVEVKVSSGRFVIHGQTLTWWYDVPGVGESERQEWIEVKRHGGVLKSSETSGSVCEGTWLEELCPPLENGCTIM
ncbi:glycoside hydrolase family 5 protein [Pleurotus eryngii]|uniref:Glycoside hydrolase family 5 protein n=1 Tax=Pleurotus eryngii TaxID=5323 RepID=A0A9P6A2V3_PLEER|nr:glycoside hydrolase family 5 protein [Pleurotus eryngii]